MNRHRLGSKDLPLPVAERIDVRALPLVDPAAVPGLPADMEARLLVPANGAEPTIILFHPASETHLEISLLDRECAGLHIQKLRIVAENMAMGEPPVGADL